MKRLPDRKKFLQIINSCHFFGLPDRIIQKIVLMVIICGWMVLLHAVLVDEHSVAAPLARTLILNTKYTHGG